MPALKSLTTSSRWIGAVNINWLNHKTMINRKKISSLNVNVIISKFWFESFNPLPLQFTALFTNMRILKFKSQLTIAFFAAVNHLNGPLRKQNFTLTGSKGQGLWFVIGGFRSVLCVSVFQGSLLVIIIMIDGSEKRNCEDGFRTLEFACLWKAQSGWSNKKNGRSKETLLAGYKKIGKWIILSLSSSSSSSLFKCALCYVFRLLQKW